MKKKYLNIALGVFVVLAIVAACVSAAGKTIKGLSQIAIIMLMAVLVINSIYDMKAGRDKSMCIIIIVIAILAAIVNVGSMIMEFMGI